MFVTVVNLSIHTKANSGNNNSISRKGTTTNSIEKVEHQSLIYINELSRNLNQNELNKNLQLIKELSNNLRKEQQTELSVNTQ